MPSLRISKGWSDQEFVLNSRIIAADLHPFICRHVGCLCRIHVQFWLSDKSPSIGCRRAFIQRLPQVWNSHADCLGSGLHCHTDCGAFQLALRLARNWHIRIFIFISSTSSRHHIHDPDKKEQERMMHDKKTLCCSTSCDSTHDQDPTSLSLYIYIYIQQDAPNASHPSNTHPVTC